MTVTDRFQELKTFCNCCSFTVRPLAYFLLSGAVVAYSQSAPAPHAPLAPALIAVKSELVVLPVRVIDGDGDFVSGLSMDNFRIYEDGRLQRISLFQREDTPVVVGLIVDHSRSMGPNLAEVAVAILSFAQSSNEQDEMFVVAFSDSVSLELSGKSPFTHDPAELARAVSAVSAGGATALYDGLIAGLNHVQLGHGSIKALIVVSDGADNASKNKYADVLALARRSQTAIYCIGLVGAANQTADRRVLQRLSNDTGGMSFFPEAAQSVLSVSTRIAHALREQYTIGFAPGTTGSDRPFRKIEVKVTAPGRRKIRVQTRPGYFSPDKPVTIEKRAP